jgi:hypothetical protein
LISGLHHWDEFDGLVTDLGNSQRDGEFDTAHYTQALLLTLAESLPNPKSYSPRERESGPCTDACPAELRSHINLKHGPVAKV